MKKPNPEYIQVNRDLSEILDRFSSVLYKKALKLLVWSPYNFNKLVYESINQTLYPAELESAKLLYLEPKLQISKSGPLGNNSYAAPRERQDYARRKPKKAYKPTPARQTQQSRMQLAIKAWKSTEPSIQLQWNQAAMNMQMGGVHLFRGIYIARLVDNLSIPEPFLPTQDLLKYYQSR
ncbi:MAG: hypothetical protein ACE14V_10215 [bacterium]